MTIISKKKLGEILLDEKLITEEQLKNALDEQKNNKLKLGQFLIRRGIISEEQMVDLLGRQLKIRKYHPDIYPFDIELSQLISIEHAQRYRLVPLNKKGRLLTVAMLDPLDI
ncbi:MAG: general secretion pathway protein GspE, partial [Desulfobacterium sp.]|nr:general secretion pathway protein GspE [Desulfobacterium sp.]MBU4035297.1 general secretion pathway protein GspE [Pseudomonadota bacterium]